jgi:hypothetical protein
MRTRRPARLLAVSAAASAGLLASMLAAGPALAQNGTSGPSGGSGPGSISVGGQTGCSGQSCYADIWQYAHLSGTSGAYTTGDTAGGQVPINIPPPPCYMQPLFSGPEMYQLWNEGQGQKVGPNGSNPEAPYAQYAAQIKSEQNNNDGYWWSPVITDTNATCSLPLLKWVPDGVTPPLPQVPGIDLADYAYNHFTLPDPVLTLNPVQRSYVSLPTYAWATLGAGPVEGTTVTLGNQSATVTATAGKLTLGVGDPGSGTVYDNCSSTGSAARPVGVAPANSGPGTTPDCGVVFHTASNANTINATITWTITSTYGGLPEIRTNYAKTVAVAEIQGLNTSNTSSTSN